MRRVHDYFDSLLTAAPVQHVTSEWHGADHADGSKDQADRAAFLLVETFAKEQGEPCAEHSASGGDSEQLWEGEFHAFHDSSESAFPIQPSGCFPAQK
jgi:hypothetical protein